MTTYNIIDLLIIACCGLLVWSIAATLTLWYERREREPKATTAPEAEDVTPTEIPENDKDWGIRTDYVERMRTEIVKSLDGHAYCYVSIEDSGKGEALTHGEAHALLLPFLQKGYYVYREMTGWNGYKVTSFRVAKHRDAERTGLEITEKLLTKNAQL
ncbi:hypothetical protein [uncultured Porphyromonas sp.]|uniref:hypothetical protein n=1 Tax=uncultured Porphyromonas sp. TaxID=159274 RepID=UPI0026366BEA|nr:hypothetical protein [uncultured Porphyromonas sp.]